MRLGAFMLIMSKNKFHILIIAPFKIPALFYGGTERVIWDLGNALVNKGFKVSFLVKEGSWCRFANVLIYNSAKSLNEQIPDEVDIVHFNFNPAQDIKKPYLVTIHGNPQGNDIQDRQSVFVSKNHAARYGSELYVYNGLDWNNYLKPDFNQKRNGFHFLGRASWKVKNLKGAISITKKAQENLNVLGGYRFNFKMGWRFTFDTHVNFKGMINNWEKSRFLNKSKGLIFPVLWHEPFGLAVIESLYFGCPVFATNYGSLPELINQETGFLSTNEEELVAAVKQSLSYNSIKCHEVAQTCFSAANMAEKYISLYEKALNGKILNDIPPQLKENVEKYLPYKN